MSWIISGKSDPDFEAYVAAVEAADSATLEVGVRQAYYNFIVGCKADGIWPAIKASCIMAGARTLAGALVPLVGTAPTNYNFVAGDYDRETGLVGDGSTKFLNSNRNNNADPQNSNHNAVYVSTPPTGDFDVFIGSDVGLISGGNMIQIGGSGNGSVNDLLLQCRTSISSPITGQGVTTGFKGIARNSSANYSYRTADTTASIATASNLPTGAPVLVFATRLSNLAAHANARLSFYSIGESLDLALLDARVTTLMSDLAAAIP